MHTWYLGVEEQLYLLYPWIFVLAHRFANSHCRLVPYIVYGALFLLSIIGARMINDQQQQHMNYGFFLLQYRAWEVLVGVITCHLLVYSKWTITSYTSTRTREDDVESVSLLTAKSSPLKQYFNARLIFIQIASIALVAWSGHLFFYPEYKFLATVAALTGTALFFVSGHGYQWNKIHKTTRLFSNSIIFLEDVPLLNYIYGLPLPSFVGRVSYALYLWHFPVVVIFADFKEDIQLYIGTNDMIAFLFEVGVTLWLSVITHYYVENPYRYWRPQLWYLPALLVLLMICTVEVGLKFVNEQVNDETVQFYLTSTTAFLPPIFSFMAVLIFNRIVLSIIILRQLCTKKVHLKESYPLTSAVLLLCCLVAFAIIPVTPDTDISSITSKDSRHNNTSLIYDERSNASVSTFWNWRGGTHSFASFDCRCQVDPNNPESPPGATNPINNENLPLCFDLKHWSQEPHKAYHNDFPHDCSSQDLGIEYNAEEI